MQTGLNKILFVEDNFDIQTIARVALTMLGKYDVCSCSSGQEAIIKAKAFHPDLLLMDIMMPGMDGLTTLSNLRKMPDILDCPVIFMTAKSDPVELDQLYTLNILGVISKPFDPLRLAENVQTLWYKNSKAIPS